MHYKREEGKTLRDIDGIHALYEIGIIVTYSQMMLTTSNRHSPAQKI
jgi:hypothetical protein